MWLLWLRPTVTADDSGGVRDGSDRSRERVLASLLSATRDLMRAEDARAIAEITVDAVNERLGHDLVAVHLLPGAPFTDPPTEPTGPLEPVAWTDALTAFLDRDRPPAFEPGTGLAWESFSTGEIRVYDDLRETEGVMDPETAFRSELHLPLDGHGLLITGSAEVAEFDAEDVYFVRALAANATAALDNLAVRAAIRARERELERGNARLERFASVVSHDIRNPLAVAQGRLEMGLESGDREEFERAQDALFRLESLVDDLLTLAREGEAVGDPSPVDPAAVAERAWENVDTGDATLGTTPAGTLPADGDRLCQLFENLFRNSAEHSSTSSRTGSDDSVEHADEENTAGLRVTVGPLPGSADGDEPAGGTSDGPRGFYVADNGPGIPPEQRDQVFEHGFSTGEEGTGLGLTIVREIAEAHGWSVAVAESDEGGAQFEFRVGED
jgi:signal transduction histidine kinase